MGFVLSDLGKQLNDLGVNGWNWRPTIELIRLANILNEQQLEWMGYNAGCEIEQKEAYQIGQYLQEKILPKLSEGDRVEYDLTITDVPDDGVFHRDQLEKNYSAKYEWLVEFTTFCLNCKGFAVY
jgi:hypothetical protein